MSQQVWNKVSKQYKFEFQKIAFSLGIQNLLGHHLIHIKIKKNILGFVLEIITTLHPHRVVTLIVTLPPPITIYPTCPPPVKSRLASMEEEAVEKTQVLSLNTKTTPPPFQEIVEEEADR